MNTPSNVHRPLHPSGREGARDNLLRAMLRQPLRRECRPQYPPELRVNAPLRHPLCHGFFPALLPRSSASTSPSARAPAAFAPVPCPLLPFTLHPAPQQRGLRESKSDHATQCFNTPVTSHCTPNKALTLSRPMRPPEMWAPGMAAPAFGTRASFQYIAGALSPPPRAPPGRLLPQALTAKAHDHSGLVPFTPLREAPSPELPYQTATVPLDTTIISFCLSSQL